MTMRSNPFPRLQFRANQSIRGEVESNQSLIRRRSLSPVQEDMHIDSILDTSNNNGVLHQTIDKEKDDTAQSTEFGMIDEHELPVLTEAAEETAIMLSDENKCYKAIEEAMCTDETTSQVTHIVQLVPHSDATLVQASEGFSHKGGGAMIVDSGQYLSESLNQSNAEPSTPELPSVASLEERFPAPIANNNVNTAVLNNEEQPIHSSTGADLTSVVESKNVTLTINLMVESSNSEQSCNPSIERHPLASSSSKIVDSADLPTKSSTREAQPSELSDFCQPKLNGELTTIMLNSQEQPSTHERPYDPSLEERPSTPNPNVSSKATVV